jgi:hypothetical protein
LVHEGGVELKRMWLGWKERRARVIGADGVRIWGRLPLSRTVVGRSWLGYLITRAMKELAGCMIEKRGRQLGVRRCSEN